MTPEDPAPEAPEPRRPAPYSRLALRTEYALRRRFGRRPPWVTLGLALAIVAVHLFVESRGESGTDEMLLLRMGALQASLLWNGEAHRLVTSLFLHAGWLHFGLNLFGLFLVGLALEPRIGSLRMASIYATAGLIGNLAFVFLRTWQPCVGASAAIYGLFAVLIALDAGRLAGRRGPLFGRRFWTLTAMIILLDAVVAMGFPIAPEAHWAGYATGALLAWALLVPTRPRLRQATLVAVGATCVVGSVYALFPIGRDDFVRYQADRTFVTGEGDALTAYSDLAARGVAGASLRRALAELEANGAEAALAALDDADRSTAALSFRILLLDDLERTEEAAARFEELLAETRSATAGVPGGDILAANNLAMQYADHDRDLEEAERMSLGACHDVGQPIFTDTLGWVHVRMGRERLGLVSLERAWQKYPIAEVAYHLAEAHFAIGRLEEAHRFVERALDPDLYPLLGHPEENLVIAVRARRLDRRIAEGRETAGR